MDLKKFKNVEPSSLIEKQSKDILFFIIAILDLIDVYNLMRCSKFMLHFFLLSNHSTMVWEKIWSNDIQQNEYCLSIKEMENDSSFQYSKFEKQMNRFYLYSKHGLSKSLCGCIVGDASVGKVLIFFFIIY